MEEIYTDGSADLGKSAGIGIVFPRHPEMDEGQVFPLSNPTNQRAELWAIHQALTKALAAGWTGPVTVYSDSIYSIKCITLWSKTWESNGWLTSARKPVLNLDIIKPTMALANKFVGGIVFKHVRAHGTNVHNNKADLLSRCHFAKKS